MNLIDVEELVKEYGIDLSKVPEHIAIIMDGNGRWANQRFLPRIAGHRAGKKALKRTLINCIHMGVKQLTVYAFSTENWSRSKQEVSLILELLLHSIDDEIRDLVKHEVKLQFLGNLSSFSKKIQEKVSSVIGDLELDSISLLTA